MAKQDESHRSSAPHIGTVRESAHAQSGHQETALDTRRVRSQTAVVGAVDKGPQDAEALLNQAVHALASIDGTSSELSLSALPAPQPLGNFPLQELSGIDSSEEAVSLELVRDVELDLAIELGRTNMYLEDVLKLRKGSVVPLDKMAGEPVDVFVNGRLIARGEVLVLNDNFCVRVLELVEGEAAT